MSIFAKQGFLEFLISLGLLSGSGATENGDQLKQLAPEVSEQLAFARGLIAEHLKKRLGLWRP